MPIYTTGKKKDGVKQYRVRVNYTEAGEHRQKEKVCYGYREAVELEERLRNQYAADGCRSDVLLRDFYGEYLAQRGSEMRETTRAKFVSNVEKHILPSLGDIALGELDGRTVANWKADMAQKGFSVTYCRRIFGSLNGLLNYAVRMRFIHENPTKNIENFREVNFTAPDERIHYYTPEQFQLYERVANAGVTSYYARSIYMFMMIAYYTGMRKGEIHALRWDDIEGNVIHVRRSISQKIKGKSEVETPPKNKASIRSLQIPKPLLELLQQYYIMQKMEYLDKWTPQYRVIYGERCISDTALSNYNAAWASTAGLEKIRIHDFRHSHASLLANEGINIQEIARRLGHSNVQITWQTYSHLYPREEERALAVLNRVVIHELSTKKM